VGQHLIIALSRGITLVRVKANQPVIRRHGKKRLPDRTVGILFLRIHQGFSPGYNLAHKFPAFSPVHTLINMKTAGREIIRYDVSGTEYGSLRQLPAVCGKLV
jgi:hypothetical protein